ncbi:MAG: ADP-ribosylglycohydrolase family protein [Planctomycetaceae bacterium]|jgi:ADP-ribosylglycohydrolase|nr:ADP-ribosylglycohydrolase family protein [Planctomycetaceae bacterium]
MVGAIVGDICGSPYEWHSFKTGVPEEVPLLNENATFTDDSVLTTATADAILNQLDYATAYHKWGNLYPNAGYGGSFLTWLLAGSRDPYNSWGNGSAMRISPVAWAFDTLEETLAEAKRSAEVTHNHPEGIKGAQAVAASIFLARNGSSKNDIKEYVEKTFDYDLNRSTQDIWHCYYFEVSCQGSVPESIISFLESRDYAHAIQIAISLGGDSDTMACIAGGIAEAFYRKIPQKLLNFAESKLKDDMLDVIHQFSYFMKKLNR